MNNLNSQIDKKSLNSPKYLNIACGGTYIANPDWENVDYSPDNAGHVNRMNVLHGLAPSQHQYEAIYCSHFIEHIPLSYVLGFLKRCHSLTKPGGLFRIVVPDAEFLLREYFKHKDSGNYTLAEFAYVNFLDQCVRQQRSGRLGDFYSEIANGKRPELVNYATYLNGTTEFNGRAMVRENGFMQKLRSIRSPGRLASSLEHRYIRIVTRLLPRGFREQNVSFTDVGELHHWMYDFEQLSLLLKEAGFSAVARLSFDTSKRADGIFLPLDALQDKPRKGHHQLFIEAYP